MSLREHLRVRSCPVCGSSDATHVVHPANFDGEKLDQFAFASRKLPELMHLNLVRCPRCTLVYATPAFTPDFLATAYRQAAYDSGREADYAARTYGEILPRVVASFRERRAALEIGAGNGAFLKELKRAGFDQVIGIEPSVEASRLASPEVRGSIRTGMFDAKDFAQESLDLVACFMTLEHVEDPAQLCQSAYALLRPGGAVFLVVHDHDSWVTKLIGRRSPIFDIEHQQLFSEPSMRYLLNACGFQRIEALTLRNRYPLYYWFKLAPIPGSLKRGVLAFLRATEIGLVPLAANIGNLAVIAYKGEG